MSLGVYLATKLSELLSAFKFFFIFVFLFYLTTGIFNSILSSMINDGIFPLLYKGKVVRAFTISSSVLSFGFMILFAFLGYNIYTRGARKIFQLTMLIIIILSMLATIVILGVSVRYSNKEREDLIYQSFLEILNGQEIPQSIVKWINKQGCSVENNGCDQNARDYVHYRVIINFIVNMILMICICLSLVGLIIVIILMGIIKPIDRNLILDQSSDEENKLTDSKVLEQPLALG